MGKSKKAEKKSKKKHKHSKHKSKKHKKAKRQSAEPNKQPDEKVEPCDEKNEETFAIPLDLMNSKSHAPETPEEYQKRQSQIRRVKDPVTGRVRLIKGDGEVLEEIVSRSRHEEINKSATQADGCYFEKNTVGTKK